MKERRREGNDDGQDAFLSAAILAFLHPFGGISDRPGDGVVAFVQGSEEKTVYCFALAAPVALPDRFGTVLYVLIYFLIAPIVSVGLRLALMPALCYVACVVWALCVVLIERALIRRYAEREAESELL